MEGQTSVISSILLMNFAVVDDLLIPVRFGWLQRKYSRRLKRARREHRGYIQIRTTVRSFHWNTTMQKIMVPPPFLPGLICSTVAAVERPRNLGDS